MGWALTSLAKAAGERAKSERAKRAAGVVENVVSAVVSEMEAEVVKDLKAKSGWLNKDDAKQVKDEAVQKVQDQLPKDTVKSIAQVSLQPEEFIRGKVEEAVGKLKG
jgi:hypothetical protein